MKTYDSKVAFIDLLMNTLVAFVGLFSMAIALINIEKTNDNDTKAAVEFIITVVWPSDLDHDIDTYVEDPQGKLVSFSRREDGLMHLNRDDTGKHNDLQKTTFGDIQYTDNKEIVSIRNWVPGEYTIWIHAYSLKRDKAKECPVEIQLDKINPYKTVFLKNKTLSNTGDKKTVCRFTVNRDGEVVKLSELDKKFPNLPK